MFKKYAAHTTNKGRKVPFDDNRLRLFDSLMETLENGFSSAAMEYVNISLWQLLCSFLFADIVAEIGKNKIGGDTVDDAIHFMKSNLDKPLQVANIAAHFHYSNSHFYSLFKSKTGYSPIHYFNHLKIQKACQLLSFSDISVKEISFKLGFDAPLCFSWLLKKTMGASPL